MQEAKKSGSTKMNISFLSILIVALLLIGGGYWIYRDSTDDASSQIEIGQNTGEQGYIGHEKAFALACTAAGVNQSRIEDFSIELDRENGRMIYEVEFRDGTTEFSYDLEAVDGTIMSQEQRKEPADWAVQQAKLSHDEALAIALKQAGFKETQVQLWKNHLKEEDGIAVYEIKFMEDKYEYRYTVDAKQGNVIREKRKQWELEAVDHAGTQNSSSSSNQTAPTLDIGETQAKLVALQHADLSEDEVQKLQVKRSSDYGHNLYEVEFYAGHTEYAYQIDAASGVILEFEREA